VGLDAILKRYFAAILLGMLALAAFFEAKGATQLVGASLLPSEDALSVALPLASAQPLLGSTARKTADPILDRNPFDSITGPLNAVEPPANLLAPSEPEITDPLRAPQCSQVRVSIVTESTDPLWSLAALQGPGDPKPTIRRVGDVVGGSKVAFIGFNAFEGSPSVWMVEGTKLCQALLFSEQPQAQPAPGPGKAPGAPAAAPPNKRGPPPIPPDMKAKIQQVSPTEFSVDRSVVDQILENQATLMRSARIVPEQKDGKVVGVRLFGIRPDTLLGTLGMQNGDRLETINGFPMASPEKALEAYSRLRTADKLSVTVSRRGKPVNIDYNIK